MKTRYVKLVVVNFSSNPRYGTEVKVFRSGQHKVYRRVSIESVGRLARAVQELVYEHGIYVHPSDRGWGFRLP